MQLCSSRCIPWVTCLLTYGANTGMPLFPQSRIRCTPLSPLAWSFFYPSHLDTRCSASAVYMWLLWPCTRGCPLLMMMKAYSHEMSHRMGTMWQPRRPCPSHIEGLSFSDTSKPFLKSTVLRSTSLLLCMAQVAPQDLRASCGADQISIRVKVLHDLRQQMYHYTQE